MRLAIHGHEVAVPDLVGKSPAAGRMIAEQSGLEIMVERQYYSSSVAEGKILSQLPPAGSQVRRGWQVRVAESLGPQRVEIPNVTGQSERAANINIRRRGLEVGSIAQMRLPDVPDGQILSQAPPPNASGDLRSENQPAGRRASAAAGAGHAGIYRSAFGQRNSDIAGCRTPAWSRDTCSARHLVGSAASRVFIPGQHHCFAKPRARREGRRRFRDQLLCPLASIAQKICGLTFSPGSLQRIRHKGARREWFSQTARSTKHSYRSRRARLQPAAVRVEAGNRADEMKGRQPKPSPQRPGILSRLQ